MPLTGDGAVVVDHPHGAAVMDGPPPVTMPVIRRIAAPPRPSIAPLSYTVIGVPEAFEMASPLAVCGHCW